MAGWGAGDIQGNAEPPDLDCNSKKDYQFLILREHEKPQKFIGEFSVRSEWCPTGAAPDQTRLPPTNTAVLGGSSLYVLKNSKCSYRIHNSRAIISLVDLT